MRLLRAAGAFVADAASLLAGGDSPRLFWFAMFYGLDWIATVPPTVRLTADAFGRENTGVIYGWIGAAHQVGASLAAFGAGSIRTVWGNYQWAFLIASALCIVASAAFVLQGARVGRRLLGGQ